MVNSWELLAGLIFGGLVAWWGDRLGAYSRSGAVTVLGICLIGFGAGGWIWGSLLVITFVAMALWSRYGAERKESILDRLNGNARRDWRQLVGGVGWAAILALLNLITPGSPVVFVAYVGALTALNADVWGTEVGVLSRAKPRLLTTGQQVAAGTPGAVSGLGIVAAIGGAWLIGFAALLTVRIASSITKQPWNHDYISLPVLATLGGIVATLVDSLLGSTAQALYYCERDERYTQDPVHVCGAPTRQVRGWPWLNDEGVDLVASLVGAAVVTVLFAWLAQGGG